jgi:hypothetical protein
MSSDHLTKDYRAAEALADAANDEIFGAGFVEYQARTSFRDMVRIYGFESARAIMAEIILSEASRKRIAIDV